jgi:hypothetical protein
VCQQLLHERERIQIEAVALVPVLAVDRVLKQTLDLGKRFLDARESALFSFALALLLPQTQNRALVATQRARQALGNRAVGQPQELGERPRKTEEPRCLGPSSRSLLLVSQINQISAAGHPEHGQAPDELDGKRMN